MEIYSKCTPSSCLVLSLSMAFHFDRWIIQKSSFIFNDSFKKILMRKKLKTTINLYFCDWNAILHSSHSKHTYFHSYISFNFQFRSEKVTQFQYIHRTHTHTAELIMFGAYKNVFIAIWISGFVTTVLIASICAANGNEIEFIAVCLSSIHLLRLHFNIFISFVFHLLSRKLVGHPECTRFSNWLTCQNSLATKGNLWVHTPHRIAQITWRDTAFIIHTPNNMILTHTHAAHSPISPVYS